MWAELTGKPVVVGKVKVIPFKILEAYSWTDLSNSLNVKTKGCAHGSGVCSCTFVLCTHTVSVVQFQVQDTVYISDLMVKELYWRKFGWKGFMSCLNLFATIIYLWLHVLLYMIQELSYVLNMWTWRDPMEFLTKRRTDGKTTCAYFILLGIKLHLHSKSESIFCPPLDIIEPGLAINYKRQKVQKYSNS